MKIGIISSQAFSLVNFRGSLIRDLVDFGVHVYALAPDFDCKLRQQIISLGAEPIDYSLARTGMNPVVDILNSFKLSLILRRLSLNVTLGYFIKPVIYGTCAAWFANVPRRIAMIEGLGYVFTDSGSPLSLKRKILKWTVELLYRFALNKSHVVIFLNNDDVGEFVKSRLVGNSKSVCIGGIGVDLAEWAPAPVMVDPITFLMAARLLREKGVIEYAESARRLKSKFPHVRFVLLGGLDSNPGGINQELVESWVEEGILVWPGHVSVKPWLEESSVYVLPSYREGVPRSTQEAMSMGRPVITTDVPGCRETIEDGVNGFMVAPRDVDALVVAMERFILDPSLIARMGLESRRMAERRFDVKDINRKLMSILGVL